MKIIYYVVVLLFMSTVFYSCSTDDAIEDTSDLSFTEGDNNSGDRDENPDPDGPLCGNCNLKKPKKPVIFL